MNSKRINNLSVHLHNYCHLHNCQFDFSVRLGLMHIMYVASSPDSTFSSVACVCVFPVSQKGWHGSEVEATCVPSFNVTVKGFGTLDNINGSVQRMFSYVIILSGRTSTAKIYLDHGLFSKPLPWRNASTASKVFLTSPHATKKPSCI